MQGKKLTAGGWLLLLYSLPAKRSSTRVAIWRRLQKTGALAFKTSAYLLPDRSELMESFQWLAQQVRDDGGEATLARVSEVEGVTRDEIVRQFQHIRSADYEELAGAVTSLIARQRKKVADSYSDDLEKLRRRFAEVQRIDFFDCPGGYDVAMLLDRAAALPEQTRRGKKPPVLSPKRYVGRTWLTRPRPEIDRVGSAWLIRRFIDPKAVFVFTSDRTEHPAAIPYDMMGVEFTHHGDDCTFETLLRRFDLKDKSLRKLGEMIHDADLEDGKFQTTEAIGLDHIFKGFGRLGLSDEEILTRGFQCFDALYEFLRTRK